MAISFTGKKRIRKTFGRIPEVATMPNLIEVQRSSYDHFLQMGVEPEDRINVGLQEVFRSVFPIRDFSERAQLDFVRYEFGHPRYATPEEAQAHDSTWSRPLKAILRLSSRQPSGKLNRFFATDNATYAPGYATRGCFC